MLNIKSIHKFSIHFVIRYIRNNCSLIPNILLGVFFIPILIACDLLPEEKSKINIDTSVVRIDIEGYYFDVPLRYMYGEAIEKRGRWPMPKKERVKVGALSLSMLLPELKPYYMEDNAQWKVKGHGKRIEFSVSKATGGLDVWYGWFDASLKLTTQWSNEGRFFKKENDIYNLTYFSGKNSNEFYSKSNQKLLITCDLLTPPPKWNGFYSPSCKVKSNYIKGLVFEYYFALEYLPQWSKIDKNLIKLLDEFAVKMEPVNKIYITKDK